MHMNKIRTTINLNKDVVMMAKKLKINISSVAEMALMNYVKELKNIGRGDSTFVGNQSSEHKKNSTKKDSQNNSVDLLRP